MGKTKRWRASVEFEIDLPAELDEGEAREMLGDLVGQAFDDADPTDAHKAAISVARVDEFKT